MFAVLVITIVVLDLALFFVIPPRFDPKRIEKLVKGMEGKNYEIISWTYFHPEYQSGGINNRTYKVKYIDKDDKVHFAHMNVSLWTYLHIVDDKIVDAEKDQKIEYEFERKKFSWYRLLGIKKPIK